MCTHIYVDGRCIYPHVKVMEGCEFAVPLLTPRAQDPILNPKLKANSQTLDPDT